MTKIGAKGDIPYYFAYFDVACAALAAGLWLVWPDIGPWPLLIGLAPWVVRWSLSGRPSIGTAFDGVMAVFFLTALVSVWAAYDRQSALAKLWLLVGAALLFYAFANWQVAGGRQASRQQAWLLSVLGALTAGYFLISNDWTALPAKIPAIISVGKTIQAPLPEFPGERLHPNVVGGILAMLAPFGAAAGIMAWKEERLWPIIAAAGLLGLTLVGLLFTMTRGSWLALGIACCLAAWWPLSGLISKGYSQRRNWYFGLPIALALTALLVLVVWSSAADSLLQILPASDSGGQRATLYANTLNLISDYPLVGSGLSGFTLLYSSYSLLAHVGFITHSHSLYFDVIIEQGVIALIALAWMWLLMFEGIWRSLSVKRSSRTRRRRSSGDASHEEASVETGRSGKRPIRYWRIVLGAGAMSLVVMLVQGLIDDPIYSSRAVVIFFLPLAFGVPILRAAAAPSRRWQARTVLIAAGLILIVAVFWWRPLYSRFSSNLAAVRQSRAELGVYNWPEWPIQDAVRREVELSSAIAGYEKALELHSDNTSANRRLGQIELSLGQYDEALYHLQKAYLAAPWDNATRQLLGEAYIVTGDVQAGRELWQSVDNSISQLEIRQYWYDYLGEDPPLTWMRQAAE